MIQPTIDAIICTRAKEKFSKNFKFDHASFDGFGILKTVRNRNDLQEVFMEREDRIDYDEWFWEFYGEDVSDEYQDWERDAFGEWFEDDGLF